MKLKTASLCKGIRIKCFLLRVSSWLLYLLSLAFLIFGIMCFSYGVSETADGVFAMLNIRVGDKFSLPTALLLLLTGIFFLLCASSLSFMLKAEFYFVTDRNQNRPKHCATLKNGVKYINYGFSAFFRKMRLFIRIMFPFAVNCVAVYAFIGFYGMGKIQLAVSLLILVFSLVFSLVLLFICCRLYDTGIYLMYLFPMLAPCDALDSSEEKTSDRLLQLALFRLMLLPRKAACLLLLPIPFFMTYTGVFDALVCEKLYGENKSKVKSPAVTFYINRKTKFEKVSTE